MIVSALGDDAVMAITMKNYGLTWTDESGVPHATVCSYDKSSAEDRKGKLEAAKCKNVRIEETKPGQLLQPHA